MPPAAGLLVSYMIRMMQRYMKIFLILRKHT